MKRVCSDATMSEPTMLNFIDHRHGNTNSGRPFRSVSMSKVTLSWNCLVLCVAGLRETYEQERRTPVAPASEDEHEVGGKESARVEGTAVAVEVHEGRQPGECEIINS